MSRGDWHRPDPGLAAIGMTEELAYIIGVEAPAANDERPTGDVIDPPARAALRTTGAAQLPLAERAEALREMG